MSYLNLGPRDKLAADYVGRRGWYAVPVILNGQQLREMYAWCWANLRVPQLHVVTRFDGSVPEGCIHDTYDRYTDESHLLGLQARNPQKIVFYLEDIEDATLFKMFWM